LLEIHTGLLTLAQIGIAMLGFGSIASALSNRFGAEGLAGFDHLRGAMLVGFVLISGGSIPLGVLGLGVEWHVAIQVSAGIMLVGTIALAYYAIRWPVASTTTPIDKFLVFPAEVSTNIGFLAVACGLVGQHGPGVYLFAMVLQLVEGGIIFLTFFHKMLVPKPLIEPESKARDDSGEGSPAD
jgi:hypothetical protein